MTTEGINTTCYVHTDRVTGLRCNECERPICVECSHDAPVGQKCPHCAQTASPYVNVSQQRSLERREPWRVAPATFSIIGIAVAVYLLQMLGIGSIVQNFAQINGLVAEGEWWRMLSAAFLHAGFWHIGFNMYALYLFGPSLERSVGSGAFVSLYLACAAAGGAAAFFLGSPFDVLVGASGAIFGLFGVWLYMSYVRRSTPAGAAQLRSLLFLLGINAVFSFTVPNISWQGHLGGLVAGALIAWLWGVLNSRSAALRAAVAAAVGLAAVIAVTLG